MRSHRRSLLEVHGVSHSSLQRHPHPDAEEEPAGTRATNDCETRSGYFNLTDRELNTPSISSLYNDSSPLSRSGLTIIEETQQDMHNIHKRAPSLQTVYSYQTESSCSWSEENDKESTEKVRLKLEESDKILYDEARSENLENDLEDNTSWKAKFPYLRIVGRQITPMLQTQEELFSHLTADSCPNTRDAQVGLENDQLLETQTCEDNFDMQEEVIDQDGICDESSFKETKRAETLQNAARVQKIKDKVLEMLVDHLLSKMAEWNSALGKNNRKAITRVHSSVTRLPPLPTANSLTARRSPVQRPLTSLQQKGRLLPTKNIGPERYLQGLLTISSKVLQNRHQNRTSDEWFNEIATENLNESKAVLSDRSDLSVLTLKRMKEHNADYPPIRTAQVTQQLLVDEVENNASLPNIHQGVDRRSQHLGTRTDVLISPSHHKHRFLSTTKNLPLLKREISMTVLQSPPSPRIISALPSKAKSGHAGRHSAAFHRSHAANPTGEVHFPFAVQRHSSDARDEPRAMLSPFSLLPIVKSLTPLASIARPKSRSEGRKLSSHLHN